MTPDESRLKQAFRELAESGPRQAPDRVEHALRAAFRARRRNRRMAWWAACGSAGAIAAGLATMALLPEPVIPRPVVPVAHIGVPGVPNAIRAAAQKPARVHKNRRMPAPSEIATGFYALPDAGVPFEYGEVVRVQLPRTAMRMVGLPVNENRISERIQAEVLLGQDGLARAVRFIQ